MKYDNTCMGVFEERINRFIAKVWVDDILETVHVKNTGRCKELLVKGVSVVLQKSDNPDRKTKYDLIAVKKKKLGWVNIDSQIPNKVVKEWLDKQGIDYIKPEFTYGNSRIDFYLEKNGTPILMEVKGCTLEIEGKGYFPDAPTTRGVKHLKELANCVGVKYNNGNMRCILAYVIAMNNILNVKPYGVIDPDYEKAFNEALEAGVEVVYLACNVTKDEITVDKCLNCNGDFL